MTETRRRVARGDSQLGGALDARLTIRAGEMGSSIRAQARELLIALSVSMFCAVTVALVVVGVASWKAMNF